MTDNKTCVSAMRALLLTLGVSCTKGLSVQCGEAHIDQNGNLITLLNLGMVVVLEEGCC